MMRSQLRHKPRPLPYFTAGLDTANVSCSLQVPVSHGSESWSRFRVPIFCTHSSVVVLTTGREHLHGYNFNTCRFLQGGEMRVVVLTGM